MTSQARDSKPRPAWYLANLPLGGPMTHKRGAPLVLRQGWDAEAYKVNIVWWAGREIDTAERLAEEARLRCGVELDVVQLFGERVPWRTRARVLERALHRGGI